MSFRSRIAVPLLAAMLAPSVALAGGSCQAPPGSAAVEQYCEAIPSAGGRQKPGSPNGSGNSVSKRTATRLAQSGADGAAILRLNSDPAAAPGRPSASKRHNSRPANRSPGDDAPNLPSTDPLRAVSSSIAGGGTLGSGFLWALVAVTFLLGAMRWTAFRRRSTDQPSDSETAT